MTAPPPPLTAEQLRHLQVLVGPDAWTYHGTLAEQVDPAAALEVHGTLKLVAADVLDLACTNASGRSVDEQAGQLRRMRIDGEVEEEYFQASTSAAVNANAWCTKAARYRKEAAAPPGARLVASPVAGMRAGPTGDPVFGITNPVREPL